MFRGAGGESPPPEAATGSAAEEGQVQSADGRAAESDHAPPLQQDAAQSAMLQGVVFHALESRNDGVLWDVQPAFVVMVDSDVAFVRQLEVTRHPIPSVRGCPDQHMPESAHLTAKLHIIHVNTAEVLL